jgi:hypothetical protein
MRLRGGLEREWRSSRVSFLISRMRAHSGMLFKRGGGWTPIYRLY